MPRHKPTRSSDVTTGDERRTQRFCTQCGAQLTENVRFCTSCGAEVAPRNSLSQQEAKTLEVPSEASHDGSQQAVLPKSEPAVRASHRTLSRRWVVAGLVGVAIVAGSLVALSLFRDASTRIVGDTDDDRRHAREVAALAEKHGFEVEEAACYPYGENDDPAFFRCDLQTDKGDLVCDFFFVCAWGDRLEEFESYNRELAESAVAAMNDDVAPSVLEEMGFANAGGPDVMCSLARPLEGSTVSDSVVVELERVLPTAIVSVRFKINPNTGFDFINRVELDDLNVYNDPASAADARVLGSDYYISAGFCRLNADLSVGVISNEVFPLLRLVETDASIIAFTADSALEPDDSTAASGSQSEAPVRAGTFPPRDPTLTTASIAGVEIGFTKDEVEAAWGPPSRGYAPAEAITARPGDITATWGEPGDPTCFAQLTFRNDEVAAISLYPCFEVETDRGAAIDAYRTPLPSIQAIFGEGELLVDPPAEEPDALLWVVPSKVEGYSLVFGTTDEVIGAADVTTADPSRFFVYEIALMRTSEITCGLLDGSRGPCLEG